MNYLITGGTGFIGSYVAKQLLADGHSVVCYDYATNQTSIQQALTKDEISQLKILQGDIGDVTQLMRVCKDNNIENVIHLAGLLLSESEVNPRLAAQVNCIGTLDVFETARILDLKRVTWASSATVYGPPEVYPYEFLPNDAPHHPTTVYGMCKDFNEYMGRHYFDKYKLDNVGLRFSLVYGVGRLRGGGQFATELIVKPALGHPAKVGYGDDTVDWIYVEDAARSVILAAQGPTTQSRAFNIGGYLSPVTEVKDFITKLLPDAKIELLPGYFGLSWKWDLTAAEKELGYRPQWTVERGIRQTINNVRSMHGLGPI